MTNTDPTFIESVEVPLDQVLTFGAFYESFSGLLVDRIDAAINSEAYREFEENFEDFDIDDPDGPFICPPDEILITSYAMVGCPRPNVAEFRVEWVRDFATPELELVR